MSEYKGILFWRCDKKKDCLLESCIDCWAKPTNKGTKICFKSRSCQISSFHLHAHVFEVSGQKAKPLSLWCADQSPFRKMGVQSTTSFQPRCGWTHCLVRDLCEAFFEGSILLVEIRLLLWSVLTLIQVSLIGHVLWQQIWNPCR